MNILITGASRGIGFETAAALCRLGHRVIAVARSGAGLEKLRAVLHESGHEENLMISKVDITSEKDLNELVFLVTKLGGRIDALIHNAGLLLNKPFAAISKEELKAVYEVNVFAVFRLTQVMLPFMGGKEMSHIVTIGSMGGINGSSKFPGLSAYSSSKGALSVLTEMLSEELKTSNIHVNCLALGAAATEMLEMAFPGFRAPLTAGEIAEFISWFSVNGQRFFNGKILPVALTTP